MEQKKGAVSRMLSKDSAGAIKRLAKDAKEGKAHKPTAGEGKAKAKSDAPSAPRQTLAQKCEAIAKSIDWEKACKIAPKTEIMIYNEDQGRWQKAWFVHGDKDHIQAILAKDLFVIDRTRFSHGNENGAGIIAPGQAVSTPDVNEEKIRASLKKNPDYRKLPVWKDQYKSMIEELDKGHKVEAKEHKAEAKASKK